MGDDGLEHRRVPLEQVQAGLPRLLADPCADDHHIRVGAVAVIPGVDSHAGGGECHPVVQVHGLALGPALVNIHQHQLIAQRLVQGRVGKAHAHHAGAHQDDFPFIQNHIDALLFQGAEGPAPQLCLYCTAFFQERQEKIRIFLIFIFS